MPDTTFDDKNTPLNYGDNSGISQPTANTQEGGQQLAQVAAMQNSQNTKTAPSATNQSNLGQMSFAQQKELENAKNNASADQSVQNGIRNSKIASLIGNTQTTPLNYGDNSGVSPAQSAPAIPQDQETQSVKVPSIDQNNSLKTNILNAGANVTDNSAGGQLRTKNSPNGVVTPLEYQSTVPDGIKLGPDAAAKAQAFGAPTIASFARDFNIPAGTDAQSLWLSGREGDANNPYQPTNSDFKQATAFCDANGLKYTSPQDARSQLQTYREAYAQSAIVNNQKTGGFGVPNDTILSDGKTKGVKLYSTPSGGGTMPPQESQPVQAASNGPSASDSSDNPASDNPATDKSSFNLDSIKNILHQLPLQDIGNIVGDLVGQGSRGKLAYAGDFNFRTPQELRQMAQTQRNSDLMKNQGLLNQQLGYESAFNSPGGPEASRLSLEQAIQKNPALDTELKKAGIMVGPEWANVEMQPRLKAMESENPGALLELQKEQNARNGGALKGLLNPPKGQGSANNPSSLVDSWLSPAQSPAAGNGLDVGKVVGQNKSKDLVQGK